VVAAATLLALHSVVTLSSGPSLLLALVCSLGIALLALHGTELKSAARVLPLRKAASRPRAAIARASAEVQPEAARAAWRAAVAWASAPSSTPGRVRSFAQRGPHCVLVEASPRVPVVAPLDAFVLEPLGPLDAAGLRISFYVVPTSRRAAPELTAIAATRLRQLLGEALAAAEEGTEAAGAACAASHGSDGENPLARAERLLRSLAAWRELLKLEELVRSSPRAKLYERLRRHLVGEPSL